MHNSKSSSFFRSEKTCLYICLFIGKNTNTYDKSNNLETTMTDAMVNNRVISPWIEENMRLGWEQIGKTFNCADEWLCSLALGVVGMMNGLIHTRIHSAVMGFSWGTNATGQIRQHLMLCKMITSISGGICSMAEWQLCLIALLDLLLPHDCLRNP